MYSLPGHHINDLKNKQIFCKWCIAKNHTRKNTWRSTALHFSSTFFARVKSRHIHFSFDVFYSSMDDLPLNITRKKYILQIMRYKKSHTKEYLCRYMTWHSFTFSLCIFLPIWKNMCYLLRHMYLFFCCFLLKHGWFSTKLNGKRKT